MRQQGIYIIECLATGDFYVGSTRNLNSRWANHRSRLAARSHTSPALQSVYDAHGLSSLKIDLVERVDNPSDLLRVEEAWLRRTRPTLNAWMPSILDSYRTVGSNLNENDSPLEPERETERVHKPERNLNRFTNLNET